ncbi:MAG: hypothetical protein ACRC57_07505 [Sarcina sp.]
MNTKNKIIASAAVLTTLGASVIGGTQVVKHVNRIKKKNRFVKIMHLQ